jgi:glycosyltransferase involved in cell wall biosynthesis
VPVSEYPYRADKDDFVLFLGRICPDKGVHLALDAARAAGRDIVVAGKCREPAEHEYFEAEVRPRLGPRTEYLGELDAETKKDLLSRARCLLFPIQWEEPFGIVMVEAMACGTPVVALDRGAVGEVVEHGVTGFVLRHEEELPNAIEEAGSLDPRASRERAATRFDVSEMVRGYEDLYAALLEERAPTRIV